MMKILIADDDALVREGLKVLINSEDDMEAAALARDGREAYDMMSKHDIDVVLMDIRMQGVDGINGTDMIVKDFPDARVLMLTTFKDDEYIAQAIQNGAKGYMLKKSIQ